MVLLQFASRGLPMSRSNLRRRVLCLGELLESRLAMATASGVEHILLPEFMAQLADPNGNHLPASDAWWALRSQRNMAIDEPISKVQNFAGHNAFNSLNEGFGIVPGLSPNQILSLRGQLDVGARMIELDIHDPHPIELSLDQTRRLILKHNFPPSFVSRANPFYLENALGEIRRWLQRSDNLNEVIFLDFEDSTEQEEAFADEPLQPLLDRILGPMIFTPEQRATLGRWPSRAEMLENNQRVVIITHRNNGGPGRFANVEQHFDPNGHRWFSSSMAFYADVFSKLGNLTQVSTSDFDFTSNVEAENANSFFSVQGDSIRLPGTARKYELADMDRATKLNVDFLKMDFLFGDDEDADLGTNLNGIDAFFDIPEDNRIGLMEHGVWSWAKNDPAVDRQIFQDLMPGDGTGAGMFDVIKSRLDLATANFLDAVGAEARQNGLDVAVLQNSRWHSATPTSPVAKSFAARSVTPNALGQYEWRITNSRSNRWADGDQFVRAEFGSGYVFAAPVNGFQNDQLVQEVGVDAVWIKVNDLDRDGNWEIGSVNPHITSILVQPSIINEAESVQLTVGFSVGQEPHRLTVDWGDGTSDTLSINDSQQSSILRHVYRDDNPTVTPFDKYTIKATLSADRRSTITRGSLDQRTAQVTVKNVAPTINSITNNAIFVGAVSEGVPVSIAANFIDPGVLDTHLASVDWGDGSPTEPVNVVEHAGSGRIAKTHTYTSGGVYTITVSVSDDDGGIASTSTRAFVTGIGLNSGTLYVIGSRGKDQVEIEKSGTHIEVEADFVRHTRQFPTRSVNQIIAYLGDGDDQLEISRSIVAPVIVHGGSGDDQLDGGGAPSVLLGENGDDKLSGKVGRSILIGGAGLDRLSAGNGGSVLIGGRTNMDESDVALITILRTWNSQADFDTRALAVAELMVVMDDNVQDRLMGGVDLDLFFDGLGDFAQGREAG